MIDKEKEQRDILIENLVAIDLLIDDIEGNECHSEVDEKVEEIRGYLSEIIGAFSISERELEPVRKQMNQ